MELKSGVYIIRCKTSGYAYIGAAVNLHIRKNTHIKLLRRNESHNKVLQFAWNMFGAENFIFEVLEFCHRDLCEEREEYHLLNHNGPLFNNVLQSRFPGQLTEAGARKRSETAKRLHAEKTFGATSWTEEGRERIRASSSKIHKGKVVLPESIAKMKATKAANPWTEEMRAAQRERIAQQRAKGTLGKMNWTPERRAAQSKNAKAQALGRKP